MARQFQEISLDEFSVGTVRYGMKNFLKVKRIKFYG